MRDIAQHILDAATTGCDLVLVTVAESEGSTPRNAGSQMLVSHDGLVCGTIGGGAMEARAITQARGMLGQTACYMEGMTLRQQANSGLDMPCGGNAGLLYTPISGNNAVWSQVSTEILHCFDQRIAASLVLACHDEASLFAGKVALIGATGQVLAGDSNASGQKFVGCKQNCIIEGHLVMPVPLPVRAIIFGGGHVGHATVGALSRVGFDCTLFDCRPEFARPELHPGAHEVILGDYQDIAASLTFDKNDYVFIMSHSHKFDYAILEQALRQPLAYVGFMGSRRKIAMARDLMHKAGIPDEVVDTVHMPIGLEIEAETPEEIAVSVAAECILHRATH